MAILRAPVDTPLHGCATTGRKSRHAKPVTPANSNTRRSAIRRSWRPHPNDAKTNIHHSRSPAHPRSRLPLPRGRAARQSRAKEPISREVARKSQPRFAACSKTQAMLVAIGRKWQSEASHASPRELSCPGGVPFLNVDEAPAVAFGWRCDLECLVGVARLTAR
jgi:hypothetical protein